MKKGLFAFAFLLLTNLFTFGQVMNLNDFQLPSKGSGYLFYLLLILLLVIILVAFILIMRFKYIFKNIRRVKIPINTVRIISKIGLLLVAIGYFLPFTLKTNVFGILNDLSRAASWLGIDIGSYNFLIYLTFISSVVGVLLLSFLFAGKSINIIIDWSTVFIANGSILILLIRLNNLVKKMGISLKDLLNSAGSKNDALQIGAYFIIVGLISSFVFLLIASFMRDIDHSYHKRNISNTFEVIKKCPFCAEEIKKEAIVCRFCGKNLPNEIGNEGHAKLPDNEIS